MKPRRTLAFSRRTLQQFRHDRRTLGFVIAMPLIMVLIFGYTFGGEVTNVKVEVINEDAGVDGKMMPVLPDGLKLGRDIDLRLSRDTFDLQYATDYNAAKQKVERGELWAAIYFPANFSQNFLLQMNKTGDKPNIEIYLDGTNPNIAGTVLKAINTALIGTINNVSKNFKQTGAEMPINVTSSYAYGGPNTKFIDYFAPGVISFGIMMVATMITIILFVSEKRNGTLQRLLVSPATEGEIVMGYALAFILIGLIQSVVILSAAILFFGVTIQGNIALSFLVLLLIGMGHQGLGILLSSGAKNELQAIQFIPLLIFPSVLLSGLFWPIESIPEVIRPLSYALPLKYGIDAERSIMVRGWGVEQVWPQLLALILFAALTLGASIMLLKRRK